jgi:hypothetical protein
MQRQVLEKNYLLTGEAKGDRVRPKVLVFILNFKMPAGQVLPFSVDNAPSRRVQLLRSRVVALSTTPHIFDRSGAALCSRV